MGQNSKGQSFVRLIEKAGGVAKSGLSRGFYGEVLSGL